MSILLEPSWWVTGDGKKKLSLFVINLGQIIIFLIIKIGGLTL